MIVEGERLAVSRNAHDELGFVGSLRGVVLHGKFL